MKLLTKLWKNEANRPLLTEYRAQQLDSLKKINRKWEIEFSPDDRVFSSSSEEGVVVSIDDQGLIKEYEEDQDEMKFVEKPATTFVYRTQDGGFVEQTLHDDNPVEFKVNIQLINSSGDGGLEGRNGAGSSNGKDTEAATTGLYAKAEVQVKNPNSETGGLVLMQVADGHYNLPVTFERVEVDNSSTEDTGGSTDVDAGGLLVPTGDQVTSSSHDDNAGGLLLQRTGAGDQGNSPSNDDGLGLLMQPTDNMMPAFSFHDYED